MSEISNTQQKKDFKWLKSIRMMTKNGYLIGDEDANRIMDYFYNKISKYSKESKNDTLDSTSVGNK